MRSLKQKFGLKFLNRQIVTMCLQSLQPSIVKPAAQLKLVALWMFVARLAWYHLKTCFTNI